MTNHAEMQRKFAEAKANNAIEGLVSTPDEEALFDYMIEQGLDAAQRKEMIDAYLAGELNFPLHAAAE